MSLSISKSLLGIAGTAGGCCAIAVPVAFSVDTTASQRSSQGGGGNALVLEKCSSVETGGEEVSFGASGEVPLCWTVEQASTIENDQWDNKKYTELFTEKWSSSTTSWDKSSSTSGWKTSCLNISTESKWVISAQDSGSGTEYLGYCGAETQHSRLFLKKVDSSEGQVQLSLCIGQCFNDTQSQSESTHLKNWSTASGTWHPIRFRKKS